MYLQSLPNISSVKIQGVIQGCWRLATSQLSLKLTKLNLLNYQNKLNGDLGGNLGFIKSKSSNCWSEWFLVLLPQSKIMKQPKKKKSRGIDGLSQEELILGSSTLVSPLATIFNHSIIQIVSWKFQQIPRPGIAIQK